MCETSWPASGSGEEQVEDAPVCVADDNSGVAHSAEGSVSKEKARGELVEAPLRESREEL